MATDHEELEINSVKLTEILEEAQGNEDKIRELVGFYVAEAEKLAAAANPESRASKCSRKVGITPK